MKILFLSGWFPYPANNGSKLRIYNLLCGLARDHEVTLLCFTDTASAEINTSVLSGLCKESYSVPWREFNPKSWRAVIGFLSLKPRFILDTYSPNMENEIRQLVSNNSYDLVIASQLTMASYYPAFEGIKAIFEEIELGGFYEPAHSAGDWPRRIRNWFTWFKLKTYLSQVLNSFAVCTVVSEKEKTIFNGAFPHHQAKALIIPNCIDLKQYQSISIERKCHHLVFSGSFKYAANYDAMLWFLTEVFPLILAQVPDTQLLITGDHADLTLPAIENVHRTGHVEDIKSLIASCSVSIVPIRSGGGTRLKILEAMAVGTPVVSTTKGAEGLLVIHGEHILIADTPEGFAAQVVQILLDQEFSRQIAANALHLVKEQYDWARIMPRLLQVVEGTLVGSS